MSLVPNIARPAFEDCDDLNLPQDMKASMPHPTRLRAIYIVLPGCFTAYFTLAARLQEEDDHVHDIMTPMLTVGVL